MASPLLRFDHVTVAVRDRILLADLDFSLEPGVKAVLCGRSGSGAGRAQSDPGRDGDHCWA